MYQKSLKWRKGRHLAIEKYEIYGGGLLWLPNDAFQLLDSCAQAIAIAACSELYCTEIQNGWKSPSLILKNMKIYGRGLLRHEMERLDLKFE